MTTESQDLGLTSLPKDGAFYSIMSPSIYWGFRTHTDCRVSTPTCIRTVCLLGETHIQTARPENILYTSMQTQVLLATQAQFHTSLILKYVKRQFITQHECTLYSECCRHEVWNADLLALQFTLVAPLEIYNFKSAMWIITLELQENDFMIKLIGWWHLKKKSLK